MSSNEFQIQEVRLENYRQYYGEVIAKFSSKKNSCTIFLGQNGVGKSNLLNAINWCLFNKEPHRRKDKQMPIINIKKLKELKKHEKIEMSVTIFLKKEFTTYRISRKYVGVKEQDFVKNDDDTYKIINSNEPIPVGLEKIYQFSKPMLHTSEHDGKWEDVGKSHQFEAYINNILPESLSKFFILDGEFLEQFFQEFTLIGMGVKQISQINIIENALTHLGEHRPNIGNLGDDISNLTTQCDKYDNLLSSTNNLGEDTYDDKLRWKNYKCHASGDPKIRDLKKFIKELDSKLHNIREELKDLSIEPAEKIEQQIADINLSYNNFMRLKNDTMLTQRDLLIKEGPKLMMKDVLKDSVIMIRGAISKGLLPNHTRVLFTQELLSKNECLCGTSLSKGSRERNKVIQVRDNIHADEDLDIANQIKYANDNALQEYEQCLKQIGSNTKDLVDYSRNLNTLDERRKIMRDRLNEIDDKKYQELLSKERQYEDQRTCFIEAKAEEDAHNKYRRSEKGELERQIASMKVKEHRIRRKLHQRDVLNHTRNALESTYKKISEEVRIKIQNKTMEFFKKVSLKRDFEKVLIDNDYELKLITKDGYNAIHDLSAGERMFLALSFIVALREITEYKFPLIIDTPLSRISGIPRRYLATHLPDLLPDSQLTLLATDMEVNVPLSSKDGNGDRKSFKAILQERVHLVESSITYDHKTSSSTIMVNS